MRSFRVWKTVSLVVTLLALLAVAGHAEAQDCGSWREAVLCTGALQVRDASGRWAPFDADRQGLRLAPGESVEIELTGRDQTGRTFPAYRLDLDTDARECEPYVEVENLGEARLRLQASRNEGRCRLEVWLPGNLNFAWRMEIEVAFAARTGYGRSEAEFIAERLFRAVLGREGNPDGIRSAAAEIERGNLEAVIRNMVTSDEFMRSQRAGNSDELLHRFYEALLGRGPDSASSENREHMRYRRYTAVLLNLIRSAEFEEAMERR